LTKKEKTVNKNAVYAYNTKRIAKSGAKSDSTKRSINKTLKELYYEDGITYTHAAEIAGCSKLYASIAFKQLGNEIAKYREKDEDWIDKNDRVRDRALEGLSRKIKHSDEEIEWYRTRIREQKAIQLAILPNAAEQLEDTPLAGIISKIDVKVMLEIYKLIGISLNMYKDYGYYIEQIINNKRAEIILHAQLQQQYDTIEILPPAREVLNAEIERRIAAKNNLMPKAIEEKVKA